MRFLPTNSRSARLFREAKALLTIVKSHPTGVPITFFGCTTCPSARYKNKKFEKVSIFLFFPHSSGARTADLKSADGDNVYKGTSKKP